MKHLTMLYTKPFEPHGKVIIMYFYNEDTCLYEYPGFGETYEVYNCFTFGDMGHWGP